MQWKLLGNCSVEITCQFVKIMLLFKMVKHCCMQLVLLVINSTALQCGNVFNLSLQSEQGVLHGRVWQYFVFDGCSFRNEPLGIHFCSAHSGVCEEGAYSTENGIANVCCAFFSIQIFVGPSLGQCSPLIENGQQLRIFRKLSSLMDIIEGLNAVAYLPPVLPYLVIRGSCRRS